MEPAANTTNANNATSTPIDLARNFVKQEVQIPALSSALSKEIKNKIEHSDRWLDRFRRVGDLLYYLQRFDVEKNDPIYLEIKSHGLQTFEDIVDKFEKKFEPWANDCLKISDFIIGEEYSVYDILILARNYDTRAGGMFVLEANNEPIAVIIKATLQDGMYPNRWVEQGEILKYYLKSISGEFGTHFKPNKAILTNPDIPVVTFTRASKDFPFVYRGIFKYMSLVAEDNGAKAFILRRSADVSHLAVTSLKYAQEKLEQSVKKSKERSRSERLKRLADAPKRPVSYSVTTTAFLRNADVITEVLYRAKGICESCNKPAPFLRNTSGEPYLEVHHKLPLAKGGEDTVENAIALCPNCHRERHYGVLYSSKEKMSTQQLSPFKDGIVESFLNGQAII